jgi:oxygen-independent coproporphyrinogen-3 oxidase
MKAIKKESEKMKEKTLQTVIQNRFSSRVLNTSYPLRPSDWFPYRVEGTLPFDDKAPLSFYVHIPFCQHLCRFCEYTRMALPDATRQLQYLAVISRDINQFIASHPDIILRGFDIGGGTPTALTDDNFKHLMSIYADTIGLVQITDDFEPSIEGTFLTINSEKLKAIVGAGFRRLSLGIQTSAATVLDAQGRSVVPLDLMKDILDKAHDAGIQKINLDLMYALPGQGMNQWKDTLDAATALGVEHISAYSLIVEPGTPMAARVASGTAIVPEDDAVNAMQRAAIDRLSAAGYRRYEISNFARPGYECRHNLVYWNRGDYLGLGCAAHSLMGGRRFHNPDSLDEYLSGGRRLDEVVLTPQDEMEETLMLSTRTERGLDLTAWARAFGTPFARGRERALDRLENGGLIETGDGFLRLTMRGMEVQDAVVLELMGEM